MDFAVLGWEDVAFRLDHRQFAYAGKFVVPSGKAAVLAPDAPPIETQPAPREGYACGIVAAVSFSADRTDAATLWVRYITVRSDRRGEGIGPRLLCFLADRAPTREYERVQIAVNNPFAFEAAYKAGFAYTGASTGLAELVCRRPAGPLERVGDDEANGDNDEAPTDLADDRSGSAYREGLDVYRQRDLSLEERRFCERVRERGPPLIVDAPA